jgi:hypothetical protein
VINDNEYLAPISRQTLFFVQLAGYTGAETHLQNKPSAGLWQWGFFQDAHAATL